MGSWLWIGDRWRWRGGENTDAENIFSAGRDRGHQCQSMFMFTAQWSPGYHHLYIEALLCICWSPFPASNNCFAEISCVSGQKSERNNLEISRTDVCNPREGHCWLFYVCELLEFENKDKLKTKVYHNCDLWQFNVMFNNK